MTLPLENVLDPYARRARFYPAIACLLPILIGAGTFLDFANLKVSDGLCALFLGIGAFVLSDIVRRLGKEKEKKLLIKWGGWPSVLLMRHDNDVIDSVTKKRYHEKASNLIGQDMPSAEEENKNPALADEVYLSVSNKLRANTYDHTKYHMLFKENIGYGFQRNMLGIKNISLFVVFLSILFTVYEASEGFTKFSSITNVDLGVVGALAILALYWSYGVSEKAVLLAGNEYARQLLATLDTP